MNKYAAEFKQVWKSYPCGSWSRRSIPALRGVTLAVRTGSICGLVGPNRAGKTTLIKLLLSLVHPSRGEVIRLGESVRNRATLSQVGYVHDSQAFPSYLTGRGLLEYYGTLTGMSRVELQTAIHQRLREVGLDDRAQESIGSFSKGMLQRLAVAQALLNDPELLILDEPGEGMDLFARHMLYDALRRHKVRGRTTILVSHSLDEIQHVCDHVAVIKYGELAYQGPLAELLGGSSSSAELEDALEPLYASNNV